MLCHRQGRDLKKARASRALEVLAEAVGFEPTVPFGTTVFKTASLSHSDTPPHHRAVAAVRRTRRTGYHIPLRLWGIACFAALRGGCLRGTAYNSLHERTSHTRRATGAGRPVYGAGLGRGPDCRSGGEVPIGAVVVYEPSTAARDDRWPNRASSLGAAIAARPTATRRGMRSSSP